MFCGSVAVKVANISSVSCFFSYLLYYCDEWQSGKNSHEAVRQFYRVNFPGGGGGMTFVRSDLVLSALRIIYKQVQIAYSNIL